MTPSATTTTAAIATAAIAGAVAILKKLLPRKALPKPDCITRLEFHQAMDATRDRIEAGNLAITNKLDANHHELLSAFDRQITRINNLETGLAPTPRFRPSKPQPPLSMDTEPFRTIPNHSELFRTIPNLRFSPPQETFPAFSVIGRRVKPRLDWSRFSAQGLKT